MGMDRMPGVQIAQWMQRGDEVLAQAADALKSAKKSARKLPAGMSDGGKPLSIVFAGQYSAGKSSLIKALTGVEDIEVGGGITTQEAHYYDWNGLKVVDTPGIHTSLRPQHDAISYQEITDADLLVYVVTQELFDDYIGNNFRKLLIDSNKASEMILVVNKMGQVGNNPEMQRIKLEDLRKVTTPYTPEDLRTVFVDAKSYLESGRVPSEALAKKLWERSNFAGLVSELNAFVQDRALQGRLTTPLYKAEKVLSEEVQALQESTGDADVDATEELLRQERQQFMDAKLSAETAARAATINAATLIHELGNKAANQISVCRSQEEAENILEEAYDRVQVISDECAEELNTALTQIAETSNVQLEKMYSTKFARDLDARISERKDMPPVFKGLCNSELWSDAGQALAKGAIGKNAVAGGLKACTGSALHDIVLNVGHFFGKSFKPWEAVKVAKGIGTLGKFLGFVGVALTVGTQIKSDIDAAQLEEESRASRGRIYQAFNDVADEVKKNFLVAVSESVKNSYGKRIADIDARLRDIDSMRQSSTEACNQMQAALNACRELISEIHADV